jgi:hypothetical protein
MEFTFVNQSMIQVKVFWVLDKDRGSKVLQNMVSYYMVSETGDLNLNVHQRENLKSCINLIAYITCYNLQFFIHLLFFSTEDV